MEKLISIYVLLVLSEKFGEYLNSHKLAIIVETAVVCEEDLFLARELSSVVVFVICETTKRVAFKLGLS